MDAVYSTWRQRSAAITERESAKAAARRIMGLNRAIIGRVENAGRDYKTWPHADVNANTVVASYGPQLGIVNGDEVDYAQRVWDVLREGRVKLPTFSDPALIEDAARLVKSGVAY